MKIPEGWRKASTAHRVLGYVPRAYRRQTPSFVYGLVLFMCLIAVCNVKKLDSVRVPYMDSEVVHDTTVVRETVRDTLRMYNTDCDTVYIVDGQKFKKVD